jgi:hypothetical protein
MISIVPAHGEDAGIYAFIHSQHRPSARLSVDAGYIPLELRIAPQRKPRRAKVPDAGTTIAIPLKPKPMGEVSNPVPALLVDETLRVGDIVVFPNGPHVFRGRPGRRHSLADFVKLTQSKRLASFERKVLSTVRVGHNDAWSVDALASDRKVAEASRDVDATGSTRRTSRARR